MSEWVTNWLGTLKEAFETGGILAAIFIGIAAVWYGSRRQIRRFVNWLMGLKEPSSTQMEIASDKQIHEKLNKLRYDSDACRTKLFQFHNGGYFMGGKSVKKMSMTHESCHPGMVPTFKGSTDMMLSLFVNLMELSHANKPALVTTGSLPDCFFKSYLQSNHVLMFSVLPVRDTKGDEIGCVLSEWCAWSFADTVQEERFAEKFSEARNSIEYILSTEKKRRK